jgi:hypothetical protein
MEFYLEISFIFENMFPIGLKPCCEFLRKFRTWFDLVWFHYAKSLKEIRFQKKKRREEIKRKGARGTVSAQ